MGYRHFRQEYFPFAGWVVVFHSSKNSICILFQYNECYWLGLKILKNMELGRNLTARTALPEKRLYNDELVSV